MIEATKMPEVEGRGPRESLLPNGGLGAGLSTALVQPLYRSLVVRPKRAHYRAYDTVEQIVTLNGGYRHMPLRLETNIISPYLPPQPSARGTPWGYPSGPSFLRLCLTRSLGYYV